MIKQLPVFAHIWLLARVYPFGSVWLGDIVYSNLTGYPFQPLQMLPLKLFCVATIAFPFLVLSGTARITLRNPSRGNKAGLICAAVLLVAAFTSLQLTILHCRLLNPSELQFWSPALVYSPLYMVGLIPVGMIVGRLLLSSEMRLLERVFRK